MEITSLNARRFPTDSSQYKVQKSPISKIYTRSKTYTEVICFKLPQGWTAQPGIGLGMPSLYLEYSRCSSGRIIVSNWLKNNSCATVICPAAVQILAAIYWNDHRTGTVDSFPYSIYFNCHKTLGVRCYSTHFIEKKKREREKLSLWPKPT